MKTRQLFRNWGNYPVVEGREIPLYPGQDTPQPPQWIARGLGRCYGDASLGPAMVSTLSMNRLLGFDESTGLLRAEGGVTFADLLRVFVPRGWFPPVTPGTSFVTLGGAIASDVHGKNHHSEGSMYHHVTAFTLFTARGGRLTCSRESHPDLFDATFGGMGLTGLIEEVALRLKPIASPWIEQTVIRCRDIHEQIAVFEQQAHLPYSVSWLDCLNGNGKGLFMGGRHAAADARPAPAAWREPRLSLPFSFPSFTLNRLSVGAFNALYYQRGPAQPRQHTTHFQPFFYPLDAIGNWNRMYGRKGFVQYQFVVPLADGAKTLPPLLKAIRNCPSPPFLAVLKRFGPASGGWLSFPMEGYTLAVDFPVRKGLFDYLDQLDARVADAGGRIYLTKDARMNGKWLEQMYPRLRDFQALVQHHDPEGRLTSAQSVRLGIHPPSLHL